VRPAPPPAQVEQVVLKPRPNSPAITIPYLRPASLPPPLKAAANYRGCSTPWSHREAEACRHIHPTSPAIGVLELSSDVRRGARTIPPHERSRGVSAIAGAHGRHKQAATSLLPSCRTRRHLPSKSTGGHHPYLRRPPLTLVDIDITIACHYERSDAQTSRECPVTPNPPPLRPTWLQTSTHTDNTASIARKQPYRIQRAVYDSPETYTVDPRIVVPVWHTMA